MEKLVDALFQHMNNFIKWPSPVVEMDALERGMARAQGFPNCCRAIDCTHITMEAPPTKFCDIYVGFPGAQMTKGCCKNPLSFASLKQVKF